MSVGIGKALGRRSPGVAVSYLCGLALSGASIPVTYATQVPSALAREATVLRVSPDGASEAVADVPSKARLFIGPPTLLRQGSWYVLYDNGTEIKGGYFPLKSMYKLGEHELDQAAVMGRRQSADTAIGQVRINPRVLQMKCVHAKGDAGTGSCAMHYVLDISAPKHFSGYVQAMCTGTLVLAPNAAAEAVRSFPHTHDSIIPVGNGIGIAVELVPVERSVAEQLPRLHHSSTMTCTVAKLYR